ncbi:hypothetical protein [Pseudoalteromonas luteoviolacea]|uniref:Methyltransferase domain-containing protein n=1 Tax=Pseudoalteromonas luteoviolacea H33 TaxID=1365251 RepID=A0A166ZLA1_9GAMM|nr:hypothetical protein [Pseudoalteromonas luteoviolacea]KZN44430.1 hypothetical protein N476_05385 [Pseudoalteromonas luteoviolacea H33]KZN78447.1 hypothetical protein N477_08575 [Pseudoalteromonas luteoviolacea H33-S]MBQ4878079.1 class I SAM-dependent methyltransferase [Pseudoalteromonas luteoviolacea]MBQ4907067.1 class I SAM-dependent methyltransferase [Pseudoalteromonas luteoviolacea]
MGLSKSQFVDVAQVLLSAPKGAIDKVDIKAMVDYLGTVTGIFTSTDMNQSDKTETASGVAISPVQAAKCFEETVRTQLFAQGVAQAINDCIRENEAPVRILYAGTGPYATLLIPLLAVSDNLPVEITLIDIHQENIDAVHKLINHFNLGHYHIRTHHADATLWQPQSSQERFDIIISETMTALLKREPQVYIFKHLVQFLAPEGVLIPQQVSLKAWLTQGENKDERAELLGEFFCLDKSTSLALSQEDLSCFSSCLTIPDKDWSGYTVKLTTDIQVYGDLRLTEGDCSLNIAFHFSPYDVVLAANETIQFDYVAPSSPDFSIVFPKGKWQCSNYELPTSDDVGRLGLVQLKRSFQRSFMIKRGERFEVPDPEWHAELVIYDMLGLSCAEVTAKMFALEAFADFELWIEENTVDISHIKVEAINDAFRQRLHV